MTRQFPLKRRAFTLIEVMVSLVIMGMIAVSMWAATSQTAKARDIVETSQERYHHVRVFFDLITRDLSSTFLSDHRAAMEPTHDTVFIGTDKSGGDRIDFTAFSHTRRYFDVKESDQAELSYYLEDDKELSGVKNLVRRESAILDDPINEGGQIMVLLPNVASFELEYYDMSEMEWKSEWDTTQGLGEGMRLPNQVRIKLVLNERKGAKKLDRRDENYREVTYGTQIPIPMRTPILLPTFVPGPPISVR